ncbi:uncharacterized protein LOC135371017 [Ornithodoros turicata]|uniref:uncharacterized protein LOC135371017 n=1 Tax=Ornithodoros turicata TaxID=34597 RepID=UPI003139932E
MSIPSCDAESQAEITVAGAQTKDQEPGCDDGSFRRDIAHVHHKALRLPEAPGREETLTNECGAQFVLGPVRERLERRETFQQIGGTLTLFVLASVIIVFSIIGGIIAVIILEDAEKQKRSASIESADLE